MSPTIRGLQAAPESANCRDCNHGAREERGLPNLERDTASPDEPLFMGAVDNWIDGCSVLVMRQDLSGIRLLPPLTESPPRLMPTR